MAIIQFVRNMDDLSTERGFQFKFHCDKCGNGYLSSFQPSVIGTAGSLLKAAGSMFGGGWASGAGSSASELQRAVGGQAHDAALSQASQEGKVHFHQCTRCGKWVCPEVCWNAKANMCDACAPKLEEEMASAQAQAKVQVARQQLFDKAQTYDYAGNVDMSAESVLRSPSPSAWEAPKAVGKPCSNCGADVGSAKFCPECGSPAKVEHAACSRCGCQPATAVKFCPECGSHM